MIGQVNRQKVSIFNTAHRKRVAPYQCGVRGDFGVIPAFLAVVGVDGGAYSLLKNLLYCNRSITIFHMYIIKRTSEFDAWLINLKDNVTRIRLARRLDKAQRGNLGDTRPVGSGVIEMREHFGAGWRMYFVQHGDMLIVMLGGGSKSSQSADIASAITLAQQLEIEKKTQELKP